MGIRGPDRSHYIDKRHVKDVGEYRESHREFLAKHGNSPRKYVGPPVVARVDHDRWLVDCVRDEPDGDPCIGGAITSPEFGIALCYGCGHTYERVLFPDDHEEIDGALMERKYPSWRSWLPGESPSDLRNEHAQLQESSAAARRGGQ